jgi:hypothetical protein
MNTLIPSSRGLEIIGALNHLMLLGRKSLSSCLWLWLEMWLSKTEHRSGALNHLTLPGRKSLSSCLWLWLELWLSKTEHRSS